MAFDAVYVSPHPDDAVFSAGGSIALDARAGRRVAVVTVFSRGIDAGANATRAREDRAAIGRLGAQAIALDLPEAPARDRKFMNVSTLFAPMSDREDRLIDEVRAAIAPIASGAAVCAPLGIGRHADHQLVHAACRALPGEVSFYEDLPYGLAGNMAARRLVELGALVQHTGGLLRELWAVARWWAATPYLRNYGWLAPLAAVAVAWAQWRGRPAAAQATLEERRIDVSGVVDEKMAAIAEYGTQWSFFFHTLPAWRSALAAHALRLGSPVAVERRWERMRT